MHLESLLTNKQAAQILWVNEPQTAVEDMTQEGEARFYRGRASILRGKSSSNPEINALIETLCGELPENLTYADRAASIESRVKSQAAEDMAFLDSKYLEAWAGALGNRSRLHEVACAYATDLFDIKARRCLVLVPLVMSPDQYLEALNAWVKEAECWFLGGTGWFSQQLGRRRWGIRESQQFSLLMEGRASYWGGEHLKQMRELQCDGVLGLSGARFESEGKHARDARWIWSGCEDTPPAESQPGPAADSRPAEPRASSILPGSDDALSGGAEPATKLLCPKLAAWLADKMQTHQLLPHGLYKGTGLKARGPDPATTRKILAGGKVSEGTLVTLARAFGVSRIEIPND